MTRELEVAPTKVKLAEATSIHTIAIQACYDLFRQLLVDDPHDQWDRIGREVHKTDPWTALDGTKIRGLWMKTPELLEDCIMSHKCTVFSVDAVEWQKSYMMGSLKKPHRMTIKKHVSCCWLHQPIANATRQLTGGRFHQEGERTIQRRHIGWNRIGHLSHQLEEPLQVEPQDRPGIDEINAPRSGDD